MNAKNHTNGILGLLQMIFVFCALMTIDSRGQVVKTCSQPVLKKGTEYAANSELYYLAWIEHGTSGQKALASLKLLELKQNVEYEVTHQLYGCAKDEVAKYSLLFSLFDQRPLAHSAELKKLVDIRERDTFASRELEDLDGIIPIPYDSNFKRGSKNLGFDWQDSAAARLIKTGYLSERAFELVLWRAGSEKYYAYRAAAKEVFDFFDGIPPFDPGPQLHYEGWVYPIESPEISRKTFQKYLDVQSKQLEKIEAWFKKHRKKLVWDAAAKKYFVQVATKDSVQK